MFNPVEYLVFESQGVVVCKLHRCKHIVVDRLNKYARGNLCLFGDVDNYTINDTFTGVARCAPEDTFDIETGKKLALIRAKAKRAKAINNAVRRYRREVYKNLRIIEDNCYSDIPDEKEVLHD